MEIQRNEKTQRQRQRQRQKNVLTTTSGGFVIEVGNNSLNDGK